MINRAPAVFSYCALELIAFVSSAPADLVIDSVGTPKEITFEITLADVNENEFRGEGFSPTPSFGQLDSDSWEIDTGSAVLQFGGTANPNTSPFAGGDQSAPVMAAGVFSFNTDGLNRILGIQPHVDHFTAGTITLRVLNGTGSTVSSWNVEYDVFAYNDTNRSTTVEFSYAIGTTMPGSFSDVTALDFVSASDSDLSPVWTSTAKSTTINAAVASNTHLFLRWTINSTGDTSFVHDEIGLDNISVTASVPEPVAALLGAVICVLVTLSATIRRAIRFIVGKEGFAIRLFVRPQQTTRRSKARHRFQFRVAGVFRDEQASRRQ